MNRFTSILLLLSLSIFGILRGAILVNYVLDYDYYVKEACENKDKPQLKCKGKCKLDKQLAQFGQSQDQDKDQLQHIVKIELSDFCHCSTTQLHFYSYVIFLREHSSSTLVQILDGFEFDFLRPPSNC